MYLYKNQKKKENLIVLYLLMLMTEKYVPCGQMLIYSHQSDF